MKTAEEHLYDTFNDGTGEPQTLEDFVSKLKAHPYHAPLIKAMQLYSDQQNKEKDAEIQRLTKEVEELKQQVTPSGILQAKTNKELTRLRELLRRSKPYFNHEVICDLPHEKQCPCGLDQLLAEISNALNPKP